MHLIIYGQGICSPATNSPIFATVLAQLAALSALGLHFILFVCKFSILLSLFCPLWCALFSLFQSASWSTKDRTTNLHQQSRALAAAERERGVCRASQANPHSPSGQEAEQKRDPAAGDEVHQFSLQPSGGPGRREERGQHH